MLISLQSFVHQLSKTNCDIKLVVGNNIVLPLQQFDISTSLSLLFLNLVEGDITNSISTLNSLVNSYDNAVLISVDILYALRSTPPLEKVILLQKLLWNFCGESKMELQNGINQVRQYAPISDQESLTFLEFINTSLNNPDDLQRLCRGQLISKLRDLIAEIHTSLGSYKELVEESMYQISSISKQFVTILSSTNTSLLQSVDIDLNKVQKVIDCNNNLTQQKVVELNNQLIELKSHWNKFTLTKDEFTYQKVPKHWILTNTTTPIGARYCWKENTKFDPHTSAITYSAVRSTMNTEESCKISKNSQPKFDFGDLECLWVTPKAFEKVTNFQELVALPGKLDISGDCIIFTKNPLQNEYPCENTKNLLKKKSYSYPYQNVVEILLRRNLTEFNGIEIFMKNNSEYYVFPTEQTAKKVLTKLLDACKLVDEPLEVKVQKATQKWTQGKINNFTYLMRLNQLSGRSYNDLSHYPIFPWVIQDYTSTKIDLNNPNIYRDLSLPIPCINPKRKAEEMKRYEELFGEHGAIKDQTPYMYPTFYSACDYVFHFLIRIEPFTTRFIRMNENHYDRPERMFYSIAHTWDICMTSSQCNIELIPEFFYLPNFLINENNFNFGVFPNTQTPLNNVELPPWAPTARDFITINAAALESPIVTAKLPQWIDLIFGFQSKGPAAVRAMNLYHPSCYVENYGGVDDDLFRKRALFSGQLPLQLFTKQHPSRTVLPPIISSLHQLSTHIDNIGTPISSSLLIQSPNASSYSLCSIPQSIDSLYEVSLFPFSVLKKSLIKPTPFSTPLQLSSFSVSNTPFVLWKSDGIITAISSNETKRCTIKAKDITVALVTPSDLLIFGCIDSLVGIVSLNSNDTSVTYLHSHVAEISLLTFDEDSQLLFISDSTNVISCYSLLNYEHRWHIKLDEYINDILSFNGTLYIATTSHIIVKDYLSQTIDKIQFSAVKLSKSFLPFTFAALNDQNVINFFCTSTFRYLPIDIDSSQYCKDVVLHMFSTNDHLYVVIDTGSVVRISL